MAGKRPRSSGTPATALPLRAAVALGMRWAAAGLRRRRPAVLSVVAVSVVTTFVAVVAVALLLGIGSRQERDAARNPSMATAAAATFRSHWSVTPYRDEQWVVVFVAATGAGAAPAPPGVPGFPLPGEVWVSPRMHEILSVDPTTRSRLPGQVVGTVGEAGLSAPDDLFAVVGLSALPEGLASGGWGTAWPADSRPTVPPSALLAVLSTLVGVPLLVLAWVSSRLAAAARRRRLATLLLIGVPPRALATAAGVELAAYAAVGAGLAAALAAGVVPVLAHHGWVGFAWFADSTGPGIGGSMLVAAVVCVVVGRLGARDVTRLRADPLGARREPAPVTRRATRVATLVLGLAGMALAVHRQGDAGTTVLASGAAAGVLAACFALATCGAVLTVPVLLATIGRRLPGRQRKVSGMLAGARLGWDATNLAASSVGMILLLALAGAGAAVLADLDAGNQAPGGLDVLTVSGVTSAQGDPQALADIAGLPARAVALRVPSPGGGDRVIGTCGAIELLVRSSVDRGYADPAAADALQSLCAAGADGAVIDVVDSSAGSAGTISASALAGASAVGGASHLVFRSAISASDVGEGCVLYVMPGVGDEVRDRWIDAVLAASPTAGIRLDGPNTYAPIVPMLRQVVLTFLAVGALLSLLAFTITGLDQVEERRAAQTPLRVIGTRRRVLAGAVAIEYGTAAVSALSLGAVLGLQAGGTYLQLGGSGARLLTGSQAVAAVACILVLAVATTAVLTFAAVSRGPIDPSSIQPA